MNIPMNRRVPAPMARLALIVVLALSALLLLATSASASSGGIGTGHPQKGGTYHDARLLPSGKAVAPATAPLRVKRAIAYANKIRKTNYVWGGGHASFESKGYDCSGAVSYMLHGAKMLSAPMASGSLESWGKGGKGKWITVYANGGHTYAEVAGLRWDTSGGPGPRWHRAGRSNAGFVVRHYKGF
jgi:hypothetical protein